MRCTLQNSCSTVLANIDLSVVVAAAVPGGVAHAGAAGVAGDSRHDSRGVRAVPVEVERESMRKGESRVKATVVSLDLQHPPS